MAKVVKLTRKEAIRYLDIEEKHFYNYHKSSGEIVGVKGENKRWYLENYIKRRKNLAKCLKALILQYEKNNKKILNE